MSTQCTKPRPIQALNLVGKQNQHPLDHSFSRSAVHRGALIASFYPKARPRPSAATPADVDCGSGGDGVCDCKGEEEGRLEVRRLEGPERCMHAFGPVRLGPHRVVRRVEHAPRARLTHT
eukprot:6204169-Pleurochrysis_carterae.AAC.1